MSSLQAFCVRCQTLTEPVNAKTVLLQNDSRAIKGNCKSCQGDVFRFIPKKAEVNLTPKMATGDAYCLKCHSKTVAIDKKTVILKSNRRALRGVCQHCQSEVYKFLPAAAAKSGEPQGRSVSLHVMSRHPAVRMPAPKRTWSQVAVIVLTVVGFATAAGIFAKASERHWQPVVKAMLQ